MIGAGRFWHGALLYDDDAEYLGGIVPFVRDGVAAGEAVLVAVPDARVDLVRSALPPPVRGSVQFASMEEIGGNPARLIPAWRAFLDDLPHGRPTRGVGEPIWPSRSPEEVEECALHESLLNRAFAGDGAFRLLCPYSRTELPAATVASARTNHPTLEEHGELRASTEYRGPAGGPLTSPLSDAPSDAAAMEAGATDLRGARQWAAALAADAGLGIGPSENLVLAVSEAVTNSVRYGGGAASLRMWHDSSSVVCEIRDGGTVADPMAGRVEPGRDQLGGRGLWLMNQLCDLVQIRSVAGGQVLRLHMRR